MSLCDRIRAALFGPLHKPLTPEQITWLRGSGHARLVALIRPDVEWPEFCDALREIVRDVERAHGIGRGQ